MCTSVKTPGCRVDLNGEAKDRVMGMVELRGIVNELIEYQL